MNIYIIFCSSMENIILYDMAKYLTIQFTHTKLQLTKQIYYKMNSNYDLLITQFKILINGNRVHMKNVLRGLLIIKNIKTRQFISCVCGRNSYISHDGWDGTLTIVDSKKTLYCCHDCGMVACEKCIPNNYTIYIRPEDDNEHNHGRIACGIWDNYPTVGHIGFKPLFKE